MAFEWHKQRDVAYSQFGNTSVGSALPAQTPPMELIPSSHVYALKRRLLVPSWWIEGILLSHGAKESWFSGLAASRKGKIVAAPEGINAKNIVPLCSIWHEIVSGLVLEKKNEAKFRFELSKHLIGTQKDIQGICHQVENIWSAPLKLFEIKHANNGFDLRLSKFGSISFIRNAQIESDVDGVWLMLNLSQSFYDILSPVEITSHQESISQQAHLVSISPVVIRAMGARASVKKLLNYLFFEYSKQSSCNTDANWNSFAVEGKNIASFHKEVLSSASSYYDHGVLGWNKSPPNLKISDIKLQSKNASNSFHETGGVVFSWNLSEQAKQACELEVSLSGKIKRHNVHVVQPAETFANAKTLFPEPLPDELKTLRERKEIKIKRERVFEAQQFKKDVVTMPLASKVVARSQTLFEEREMVLSDNKFMVLVSEFYESLKPLQKSAFERDRRAMTKEQFRSYMIPILQRKKHS